MAQYDVNADALRVIQVAPPVNGVAGGFVDPNAPTGPTRVALVTPNDTTDLPNGPWRYISFGTAGTLKVTTSGGDTVTIPSGSLGVGLQHFLNVQRVFATGTTATNIVVYK